MESLFVLLPAIIYWCMDEKKGLGLSLSVLLSIWIVFFLEYRNVNLPFGAAAGWIIAAVIIFCYFLFHKKIETLFARGGFRAGMITTAVVSFLMILRLQGEKLLIPGGILLGIGTGFCLNLRYIGFKSRLLPGKKDIIKYSVLFIRLLLGITGFMLILSVTEKIIPWDSGNVNLYGLIRYALAGLWISAAAPWIFIRLRLAVKAVTQTGEDACLEKSE